VLVLAFDTSTPTVSVALADTAEYCRVLSERNVHTANQHGELLMPLIHEVLDEAGVTAAGLAAVAVGLGPGPFTGLRVGIATAAALSDALGIRVYAVCSLDLVAYGDGERDYVVMTDARRRRVYWAHYSPTERLLGGPELDTPQSLADRFAGARPLLVGDGAELYRDTFAGFEVVAGHPRASRLAAEVAARVRQGDPSDALEPLYLRRPDARPPGPPKSVMPA
jgi:tRNA threonylcarbamoyl adenosine modification protein YeaZ